MKDIICTIKDKDFLNRKEVCAYLDISKDTLEKWIEDGLQIIKKNGKHYISKEHIKKFLHRYTI